MFQKFAFVIDIIICVCVCWNRCAMRSRICGVSNIVLCVSTGQQEVHQRRFRFIVSVGVHSTAGTHIQVSCCLENENEKREKVSEREKKRERKRERETKMVSDVDNFHVLF